MYFMAEQAAVNNAQTGPKYLRHLVWVNIIFSIMLCSGAMGYICLFFPEQNGIKPITTNRTESHCEARGCHLCQTHTAMMPR